MAVRSAKVTETKIISQTIHSGKIDFHSDGCTSMLSGNLTFHSDGHTTMKICDMVIDLLL